MSIIQSVTRKFIFNGVELIDIPELTPEQIKEHYSTFHPEMINAQINNKGIDHEGQLLYEFSLKVGTNG